MRPRAAPILAVSRSSATRDVSRLPGGAAEPDAPSLDWYRYSMAFLVRLSSEDTEELRAQAAREHRSMHEVAVLAIQARIGAERRAAMLDALFDEAAAADAELLDRLGRW